MNTSVRTIGFIGSGNIGGTVAKLAIAAGYHVVLSNSRGPETLAALCAELGKNACAKTPQEAAQAGDLVVLTVPFAPFWTYPLRSCRAKSYSIQATTIPTGMAAFPS